LSLSPKILAGFKLVFVINSSHVSISMRTRAVPFSTIKFLGIEPPSVAMASTIKRPDFAFWVASKNLVDAGVTGNVPVTSVPFERNSSQ